MIRQQGNYQPAFPPDTYIPCVLPILHMPQGWGMQDTSSLPLSRTPAPVILLVESQGLGNCFGGPTPPKLCNLYESGLFQT